MRGKHVELLRLLGKQNTWITAKQMAKQLQVSERSIKNYIGEINYQEENLIEASKNGYRADKNRIDEVLSTQKKQLPETSAERVNYIITELLSGDKAHESGIDLYDISEKIYVSYETLRKDLVKVRKKVKEHNLYASVTGSIIKLEGKELDKRKLLSMILYEEFNQNLMSLEMIQKAFPDYDMEVLRKIIVEECKRSHYYINDYAMLNLILDISISMERIRKNCTFRTHVAENREFGEREKKLVEAIAKKLEEAYAVRIEGLELQELTALILSHLMTVDVNALNLENIGSCVPPESMRVVQRVLEYLNENYYIDTTDEGFMVKFAVHIHNLLMRLENEYTAKNPLTDHIKNSCPLIFECAVGVANCLNQMTGHQIDEDEIAYIALHIGGNLENYREKKEKLSCIIVCPHYYNMPELLVEKISAEFSERLLVRAVLTQESELAKMEKADFIISTTAFTEERPHAVTINPFLRENDLEKIRKEIAIIQKERKKDTLREALEKMTTPEMFYNNPDCGNRKKALEFMIRVMQEKGYADDKFMEKVEERERHSSTAFGRLAVPHAMELNAQKTGIGIMLNEKGVEWEGQTVNLILLFAINKEDRNMFHEVFDNLIVLLLENQNLDRVLQSTDYESFLESIMCCE